MPAVCFCILIYEREKRTRQIKTFIRAQFSEMLLVYSTALQCLLQLGENLPILLRIVTEVPKNATGKVMKKNLVKEVFPPGGHRDVQRWKPKRKVQVAARL